MEFKIKAGVQGHYYLPKIVREAFGDKLTLLPNAKAGVIYPNGANLKDVIASLHIIIQDLELRSKEPVRSD